MGTWSKFSSRNAAWINDKTRAIGTERKGGFTKRLEGGRVQVRGINSSSVVLSRSRGYTNHYPYTTTHHYDHFTVLHFSSLSLSLFLFRSSFATFLRVESTARTYHCSSQCAHIWALAHVARSMNSTSFHGPTIDHTTIRVIFDRYGRAKCLSYFSGHESLPLDPFPLSLSLSFFSAVSLPLADGIALNSPMLLLMLHGCMASGYHARTKRKEKKKTNERLEIVPFVVDDDTGLRGASPVNGVFRSLISSVD